MTLVSCPACGGPVSHLARACPRCGYAMAVAPPSALPPKRSGTRAGVVVAVVGMVGLVGVVLVVGVFAAVAIPRFGTAVAQAKEQEAVTLLGQLHTFERFHHEATGAYTANLGDPAADDFLQGWGAPTSLYYDLSVSEAGAGELCLEATPRADAAELRALSMDENGALYGAPGCAGPVLDVGGTHAPGTMYLDSAQAVEEEH